MYFNKEYMLFEARKQMFVNFMNKISYQFWLWMQNQKGDYPKKITFNSQINFH